MPDATVAPESSSAAEPVTAELVALPTTDALLHDLEDTRAVARRWRGRFVASCVAFGCLLLVSIIQFAGTFITCQMLHEARVEIDKALMETRTFPRTVHETQAMLQQANQATAAVNRRMAEAERSNSELRLIHEELQLAYKEQEVVLNRLLEWQKKVEARRAEPRETLPPPKSSQE